MHGLVITLDDADHMTQQWTWMEAGKSGAETFHFERKKS
jgi:YD repeat-containing protein